MIKGLEAFYKKKGYLIKVPKKYEGVFETYGSKIKELIEFLKGEYLKKCMAGVGICNLPNGKEMYRYLVKSQTTTNRTPEDVYVFGLKEVSRIKGELEKLKGKMGFKCSLLEFYKKMKADPKNYCNTKDDVVKGGDPNDESSDSENGGEEKKILGMSKPIFWTVTGIVAAAAIGFTIWKLKKKK